MKDLIISSIDLKDLNVELTDSFTISRGSVDKVRNLLITLTTESGLRGYGEITPFQELSGDDRDTCITRFMEIKEELVGKSLAHIRRHSDFLAESLPDSPAVRCGIEISMLDTFTRYLNVPLWAYFGGKNKGPLLTDITIPILSFERSLQLADEWIEKGFSTLKIKVGLDFDQELRILTSIAGKHPDIRFIVDANQGFGEKEALEFARLVLHHGCKIILFEQPVNRHDLDGMARLTRSLNIPVAADESVFTREDLQAVIKRDAANVVNLKIMKSGVFQVLDIATTAKSFGLDLMIGGMVETRLAMAISAAIAMGFIPVKYIDLDTPLLMKSDPLLGGYSYCGSELRSWDTPGTGIEPVI